MKKLLVSVILGLLAALVVTGRLRVGGLVLNARDLEQRRASGKRLATTILGGVVIGDDVTPELAADTIQRLTVYGGLVVPRSVLKGISGRVKVTGGIASR